MASLWLLALLLLGLGALLLRRRLIFTRAFSFPGPRAWPVIGNCHLLLGSQSDFFRLCWNIGEANPRGVFQLWVGMRPFVFLYKSPNIRPLVTSSTHLEKNFEYSLTEGWLGKGLITSTGSVWQKQRKMLTSCFHFTILREFSPPVWRHGQVLLQKLTVIGEVPLDIVPLAKLLALDIICETAMGIDIATQANSDTEYPSAISRMTDILSYRFITPWIKPKAIFNLTPRGREYNKLLSKVQSFVRKIIVKRKEELVQKRVDIPDVTLSIKGEGEGEGETKTLVVEEETADLQTDMCKDCLQPSCRPERPQRRLALLDCLLKMSLDDPSITDEEITDQVNTFMFAGHDTVACALSFTLFALGHHQKWQDAIVEEVDQWCPELLSSQPETRQFLHGLPVLDRCVREAMRLYPPSPMVGRTINHPLVTPEGTLPTGTTAIVYTFLLHRDPDVFSDPHEFDPDRFLPQNMPQDPFAYVPFSAGPRNCIGKNLAMLELKILVAMILKSFTVKSLQKPEELDLSFEIVLTNKSGIFLQLEPRK